MAHPAQKEFFREVKKKYPEKFHQVNIIDCGSLDVNGSLKDLFTQSQYTGVDIVGGKNVDVVSHIKDITFEDNSFDTVISGEMLEHDETWRESLQKMYDLCKSGGLLAISCAGKDRREHGTRRTTGMRGIWGTSPDYYMNLEEEHFREVYKDEMFTDTHHEYNPTAKDQYFYGIKK
jgi:SAM-dependent methyltransferase